MAPKHHALYVNGQYFSNSHSELGQLSALGSEYRYSSLKTGDPNSQQICEAGLQGAWESFQDSKNGFFPFEERRNCLKQLGLEIEKQKENLVRILAHDIAKPVDLARAEVERCLNTIRLTLELDPFSDREFSSSSHSAVTKLQARGPLVAVTPYNFPFNLAMHKIAPAILAGIPVIWKPSPHAVLSSLTLMDQFHQAKIPAGFLQFLPMDNEMCLETLKDQRVAHWSFTGSSKVGWNLRSQVSGKPCTLELGGFAPVYVDHTANLELAAQKIAASAFSYAGQVCISTQNVFCHKEVFSEFRSQIESAAEKFSVGRVDVQGVFSSGVISEARKHDLVGIKKELSQESADTWEYPAAINDMRNFIAPTIFYQPSKDSLVFKEELFAPFMSVNKVDSWREFLDQASSQSHRLQASVFSEDLDSCLNFNADQLPYGAILLNEAPSLRIDQLPYGGEGLSGLGREGPAYAYRSYHFSQNVVRPV